MVTAASLPGGWWENGVPVRDAELRALTAEDEIALSGLGDGVPLATYASEVLGRSVVRIGARAADSGVLRDLAAGDREALLLQVRRLNFGDTLMCVVTCPSQACGKPMDLELRVRDLLLGPYEDWQPYYTVGSNGLRATFRVPTGADLEAVAPTARTDPHAAARMLLKRIVVDAQDEGRRVGGSSPDLADLIAQRLSDVDPQAELRLNLRCAECGVACSTVLNSAAHLRAELAQRMRRIYEEVHTLASTYHWSEAEILRMPEARRRVYLQFIERAAYE
jgi:hypothetical protein